MTSEVASPEAHRSPMKLKRTPIPRGDVDARRRVQKLLGETAMEDIPEEGLPPKPELEQERHEGGQDQERVSQELVLQLFDLVRKNDATGLQSMLSEHPHAAQRAKDSEGCTAAHAAAVADAVDALDLLLQYGANLDTEDGDGWTPLHFACANGREHAVEWLVQNGASQRISTSDGWLPFHVAAHSGQTEVGRILAAQGQDVRETTESEHEPIHLAVDSQSIEFVKWLLNDTNGAAATALDPDGWLPMHSAASAGNEDILRHLYGSGMRVSINAKTLEGYTALDLAMSCKHPNTACVEWLLSKGAERADKGQIGRGEQALSITAQKRITMHAVEAARKSKPPMQDVLASARLPLKVRAQAAHYIDATLSRTLLIKHLKADLSAIMERGRMYKSGRITLVKWNPRYLFCTQAGLAYQKVTDQMRPYGKLHVVPWGSMSNIEVLADDSIFIEKHDNKQYYFKLKGVTQPAEAAWAWASRLCQLCQLLGETVSGYVAEEAYAETKDATDAFRADPEYQPDYLSAERSRGGTREPQPTTSITLSDLAALRAASEPTLITETFYEGLTLRRQDGEEEADDEEETEEEAYRRRQWIFYYVSMGAYQDAEDIGWDGVAPPDPRVEAAQMLPGLMLPGPLDATRMPPNAMSKPPSSSDGDLGQEGLQDLAASSESGSHRYSPRHVTLGWLQQRMSAASNRTTPTNSRPQSRAGSARDQTHDWYTRLADIGVTAPNPGMRSPTSRRPGRDPEGKLTSI